MTQRLSADVLRELGVVQLEEDFFVYPADAARLDNDNAQVFEILAECTLNVPHFPFGGFGYSIAEEGMVETVARIFGLLRLQYVGQLGFLQDPIFGWSRGVVQPARFTHTRFLHSLDVYALVTLIARNNWKKLGAEQVRALQVAALTHDVLTPAGGDTIKHIDPRLLNEDSHYREVLSQEEVAGWCILNHIDQPLLVDTVAGKGLLGSLLDLADKIAYVGRDTSQYLTYPHQQGEAVDPQQPWPPEYRAIQRIISDVPDICTLWDAVSIKDGQVFVEDVDRLVQFLTLRARMFQGLYLNVYARYGEERVMETLVNHLYTTGRLSRNDLLAMTDFELIQAVEDFFGILNPNISVDFKEMGPHFEFFPDLESARKRERELLESGVVFVKAEDVKESANPATDILVQEDGNILPLCEARPKAAERIERIIGTPNPVRVSYLTGKIPLKKKMREAVIRSRFKQLDRVL